MRKILIISYYFSSTYETGGIRAQKFVKYLPHFDFEPIVITKKRENPYPFKGRMISLRTLPINKPFHLESLTWLPGLFFTCLRLIRNEKIGILLFSCGPFSSALIGLILKVLFNIRLVLDYRDYWTISPYIEKVPKFNRSLNRLQKPFEKMLLRSVDKLVVIQQTMQKKYIMAFPFLKGKVQTIFNGFDTEDIPKTREDEFDKFTLLYLGNLHLDLNMNYPMLFLENLQEMKANKLVDESNFQVFIVGERFNAFEERVQELGLAGIVKTLGRLPHLEAVRFLMRSHLLLLMVETEGIITSKVFEYLASGKPILALINPGELMDLIREYSPVSTIVTSYDSKEIMKGIQECLRSDRCHLQWRDAYKRFRSAFNRRELTRQLVEILNVLLEDRRKFVQDSGGNKHRGMEHT
jgi:glycosyltransferase involved in cell wall biosynthesis